MEDKPIVRTLTPELFRARREGVLSEEPRNILEVMAKSGGGGFHFPFGEEVPDAHIWLTTLLRDSFAGKDRSPQPDDPIVRIDLLTTRVQRSSDARRDVPPSVRSADCLASTTASRARAVVAD